MNKKVLVFSGVFLLVIVALFSIMLRRSISTQNASTILSENKVNSASNNIADNNLGLSNNPTLSGSITPSNATTGWEHYYGDVFSLKYPQNWSFQDESLDGYIAIKFSPVQNGYYDPIAPVLFFERYDNSDQSLKDRESLMPGNAKVIKTQISNKSAESFSFKMPGPIVNNQSYGQVVEVHIFFANNTHQYEIVERYSNAPSRINDIKTLEEILATIKIY